ncbi:putative N-methylcoclaurine 3'-monooxygenase [Helianthus anomalus]
MNYTIPRNTQIFINVWAIGRDPEVWEEPFSFRPERFLGSHLDFKGQDFEFIPFGAGRRMCPGLPSGIKSVQSILASLIKQFRWVLPNDEDPSNLDMNEKFGVTLQKKKPLQLIIEDLE